MVNFLLLKKLIKSTVCIYSTQSTASVPPNLESKEASMLRPKNSVLDNSDIFFYFSTEKSVFLSQTKCKDYYL